MEHRRQKARALLVMRVEHWLYIGSTGSRVKMHEHRYTLTPVKAQGQGERDTTSLSVG